MQCALLNGCTEIIFPKKENRTVVYLQSNRKISGEKCKSRRSCKSEGNLICMIYDAIPRMRAHQAKEMHLKN